MWFTLSNRIFQILCTELTLTVLHWTRTNWLTRLSRACPDIVSEQSVQPTQVLVVQSKLLRLRRGPTKHRGLGASELVITEEFEGWTRRMLKKSLLEPQRPVRFEKRCKTQSWWSWSRTSTSSRWLDSLGLSGEGLGYGRVYWYDGSVSSFKV